MILDASTEVNPASCILSVFLEISWLTFVQNEQKWESVIERSLSWELFSMNKNMEMKLWGENLM
jgi:hypothetical protein